MSVNLESCSVGTALNEVCHKTCFSKKVGFVNSLLTEEEIELTMWRSKIDNPDFVLCYHHKETILNRFSKDQTSCCDPFGDHANNKGSKKRKKSKVFFVFWTYSLCLDMINYLF